MTSTTANDAIIRTAEGVPLKLKLLRTTRRNRIVAFCLVVPLLLFILVTFLVPIAVMLLRSVDNPIVAETLPQTVAALEHWSGQGVPDEAAFAALAEEFTLARENRTIGRAATRLNFELSGMRSLVTSTARTLSRGEQGPYKELLIEIDGRWGEQKTWATIKLIGQRYTTVQYLASFDLHYDAAGRIVAQPEVRQIYVQIFMRTLWVSLLVTVLCLLLGYPVAYLLSTLPSRISNMLMILVLLPFWTSLLVRTTAWIVLLQTHGVINDLLVWAGLIGDESRVQMIYNMTGTIVAMTHILLPFMVLPIYSVMKTISPSHMRAALSLGANPLVAFWRVYAPQTVPGIGAGSILVFIISIGYYITPALVGGRTGQLISNFIAFHMQKSLNWGLAAALGTVLLACVLLLYWLYSRVVGLDKLKLG
ncbi:MAG: ABC transporter permease [Proteobacteria bacterium]|nr:ABC transporter permease [Pseudomonadota bacterium]